jgi:hypothetical protein
MEQMAKRAGYLCTCEKKGRDRTDAHTSQAGKSGGVAVSLELDQRTFMLHLKLRLHENLKSCMLSKLSWAASICMQNLRTSSLDVLPT